MMTEIITLPLFAMGPRVLIQKQISLYDPIWPKSQSKLPKCLFGGGGGGGGGEGYRSLFIAAKRGCSHDEMWHDLTLSSKRIACNYF